MLEVMEPQDTPPYAPLDGEAPRAARATPAPAAARTSATPDRTRRTVAIAAGAAFLAAMTGMAFARSGGSSGTTATSPDGPAPQQLSTDDQPTFPSFGDDDGVGSSPRAALPAAPFFGDGGGRTQSRGS